MSKPTIPTGNVAVAAVALPSLSRSKLSALKSGCGCGGVGDELSQAEPTEKAESSVPVKGRNCVRNFLVSNFYLHWPGGMEKRLQLQIQLQCLVVELVAMMIQSLVTYVGYSCWHCDRCLSLVTVVASECEVDQSYKSLDAMLFDLLPMSAIGI